MPSSYPATRTDAGDVFDRLLTLSHAALEALEAADMERLGEIMAERAAAIQADSESGHERVSGLAGAIRLREADTRLELALTARREEIVQHLDAMDSGEAVRSAYGSRERGKGQINVVR